MQIDIYICYPSLISISAVASILENQDWAVGTRPIHAADPMPSYSISVEDNDLVSETIKYEIGEKPRGELMRAKIRGSTDKWTSFSVLTKSQYAVQSIDENENNKENIDMTQGISFP